MRINASGREEGPAPRVCGIVRPIADFEPYPLGHWSEVHAILADALTGIGFEPRLVSESESAGVIQGNIVTNLYEDEIVICDVSGRNPNVMFELGMRVAFEKPVVIIKDEITPFSFDVAPIKHLTYPHTLRYADMNRFKEELARTVAGTLDAAKSSKQRGYLQQFGNIKATEIGDQTISLTQMAEDMRDLKRAVSAMNAKTEVAAQIPRSGIFGFEANRNTTGRGLSSLLEQVVSGDPSRPNAPGTIEGDVTDRIARLLADAAVAKDD